MVLPARREGLAGVVRARVFVLTLHLGSALTTVALMRQKPANAEGGRREEHEGDEEGREKPGHGGSYVRSARGVGQPEGNLLQSESWLPWKLQLAACAIPLVATPMVGAPADQSARFAFSSAAGSTRTVHWRSLQYSAVCFVKSCCPGRGEPGDPAALARRVEQNHCPKGVASGSMMK